MTEQELKRTIKWDNVEDKHKRTQLDGTETFWFHLPLKHDVDPSLVVHMLFNHKRYGFNNIFKDSVPRQELQDLYKKCLIDINTSGGCAFVYRGICFTGHELNDVYWGGVNAGLPAKNYYIGIGIGTVLDLTW